jgi:proteasome lid subunit RPN8/RPN11
MWKIKKDLINELLNAAQNNYPNEFICFLGGTLKNYTITEFIFFPSETDKHSASVNLLSIPIDDTIIGSLHSHPNSNNHPSNADKKLFNKYQINLILGYPFIIENIGAYDNKSNKILIELI